MKFEGHLALARKIAASVPAVRPYLGQLEAGSLQPDRDRGMQPGYARRRIRHHSFGINTLRYHHLVERARRLRLAGRPAEAAFQLGVFLHYLADDAIGYHGLDSRHSGYAAAVGWWLERERTVTVAMHYGSRAVEVHRYRGVAAQVQWHDDRQARPASILARALVGLGAQTAAAVFEPVYHSDDAAWLRACEAHHSSLWQSAAEVLRGGEADQWSTFLRMPFVGPRMTRMVRDQKSRRQWWYRLEGPRYQVFSVATSVLILEAVTCLLWLAARPLGFPLALGGIAIASAVHARLVHRLAAWAGADLALQRTWTILALATAPVFLLVMSVLARARIRIGDQ